MTFNVQSEVGQLRQAIVHRPGLELPRLTPQNIGKLLLSEEYDPSTGRMLGNFPQAFSHVALINTAANLSTPRGPSQMRTARPGGAPQPIVTSS
jgi:GH15 family glucan-1,4-alpha-glucosidase